ncbi:D-alanyl-lipoteichoic acid biosynthesis protein DltD [Streptococcus catagoni]|uniref:D-alanyl-lipoteichoic acid biosynthesis protein DltD n=1 Tax=Streptococcus catagoni TaxID=2654874 RepID=UPI00140C9F0B|nr:D-alanyl-lipoteichoic acid biosynthesis protein DltD [Streptococcus catagoni]
MLKKLGLVFGPLLVAIILVVVTIGSSPICLPHNLKQEKTNAVSLSDTSFKNSLVKKQAFSDPKHKFVPFFGSSEWSRMDSMHPYILAEKYKRDYRPYLVGKRGTQSLSHYFGIQGFKKELENGKAVLVISPQWFSPQGTDTLAVQKYMSNSQIISFLRNAKFHKTESRIAAQRLLQLNPGVAYSRLMKKIARGDSLSALDNHLLNCAHKISLKEESFFSQFSYSTNYQDRIEPRLKGLPKTFSYDKLGHLAMQRGEAGSSNNRFGINNNFYSKRIAPQYASYKNFQANNSFIISPEYTDFQLLLSQLAEDKVQVLFVIPPVNKKWADYTGLNQGKYQRAVQKIKYQLQSQGFTEVVDFSKEGGKPYFMQDTIHLGWNGWLELDKKVLPFMKKKISTDYHVNDYFLSKEWANLNYQVKK